VGGVGAGRRHRGDLGALLFRGTPLGLRGAGNALSAGWQRITVVILFVSMLLGGLALFYRTAVEHRAGLRRRVWPGAIVALSLWAGVSWIFGRYVEGIAHYAIYYGSLATVAVALLWLYLTSLALVVGAEVNAQLEGARDLPPPPDADAAEG